MAIFDEEQAQAKKAEKQYRDLIRHEGLLRDNMVRQMADTPDGRAYLRWLLVISGAIGRNPFDPDRSEVTAFLCGQMAIGQTVLSHILSVDPTILTTLLMENPDAPERHQPDDDNDSDERGDEAGGDEAQYN